MLSLVSVMAQATSIARIRGNQHGATGGFSKSRKALVACYSLCLLGSPSCLKVHSHFQEEAKGATPGAAVHLVLHLLLQEDGAAEEKVLTGM